ncbi:MAG: porin [Alphaproteobacteria bacterium]|nr:porin [Alphaproteobacteria bacterium]
MKKTAFVIGGIAAGLAFPAWAGEVSYGVEGQVSGAYGYSDIRPRHHGVGKGSVYSYVEYEFDADSSMSAHLDLMGGVDKELKDYNQGDWGEEVWANADTKYGQVMAGQVYNVASLLHSGAPMAGVLSSNSEVADFLHNPNWRRTKKETRFATLNATDINTDGVAPKISYITPEVWGSALGVSWMPDSYNRRGLINKHAGYAHKDGFAAGVYSDHRWGNINSKTSLGYAQYHGNDKEFSAGLNLNRGNWTLGGGVRKTYIDGDDKSTPKRELPDDFDSYREGYAWSIGAEYEIGPFATAVSYFRSKQHGADNSNGVLVWSNKLQLNKYAEVYVAAARLNYRFNGEKDDGYAGVAGVGVNF